MSSEEPDYEAAKEIEWSENFNPFQELITTSYYIKNIEVMEESTLG